jgi:isopentenyldiphosphate isomerase
VTAEPTDDQGELLVVVDGRDEVVGHRTRRECHADPTLVHRSVHVLVETRDGMLFQRRGFGKDTGAGAWDTACAGHVSPGETYERAAARELLEELGLAGAEPELLGKTIVHGEGETELCAVFRLRHDGPFSVSPPEVAGLAVFRPGERPAPLTPAATQVLAWLGRHGLPLDDRA